MSEDREIEQLVARAEACLERGDLDGGIAAIEAALAIDPDDALLHAWLAVCLADLRFVDAARAEAEIGLSLDPTAAYVHRALGQVEFVDGKRHEARRHLETAISLDEGEAEFYVMLWRIKRLLGEHGDDELEVARELDPEDPDVLLAWAELERGRGNLDEAERYVREVLESNPEHGGALVEMGWILLERGELDEAHEHVVTALRADPTSRDALLLLASYKARRNWFLGLWFRWNNYMASLGDRRSIGALLAVYLVYRLVVLILDDFELRDIAQIISYVWLALVAYTWLAPMLFERMIRRELDELELDPDY